MIRYDPDDENAGTQTVNDIFPTCSADTLDGERLAQEPLSQCAYFRANVRDWGQKMSRFQGIYQDGLLTIAELESIDERSSARGYRLYSSCHSIARPGQPLGERQQEQGATMIKAARTRMVEELLKAGWKLSDPANAEASVTVWKYQR
jgi:hypothetical protein